MDRNYEYKISIRITGIEEEWEELQKIPLQ